MDARCGPADPLGAFLVAYHYLLNQYLADKPFSLQVRALSRRCTELLTLSRQLFNALTVALRDLHFYTEAQRCASILAVIEKYDADIRVLDQQMASLK